MSNDPLDFLNEPDAHRPRPPQPPPLPSYYRQGAPANVPAGNHQYIIVLCAGIVGAGVLGVVLFSSDALHLGESSEQHAVREWLRRTTLVGSGYAEPRWQEIKWSEPRQNPRESFWGDPANHHWKAGSTREWIVLTYRDSSGEVFTVLFLLERIGTSCEIVDIATPLNAALFGEPPPL